jgi:uncharacterized protein YecE (DUF72 family)
VAFQRKPHRGLRLCPAHGDKEIYASGYGDATLDRWSARIDAWRNGHRDVFCYFDNDTKVRAPYDAANLARRLGSLRAWHRQGGLSYRRA